ncbi:MULTISPECIES: glycerol kinase [Microbacterium]|uniref:FGGY-family carbohydrate kinase n=1 Tax=Microbacterium TaxID=33882 RepID=UPI0027881A93|nr:MULTISPECIES: FGGY family carbohydrate kinase [Microbacterium]MDQ1082523.1 glycerol kinase [Microbacterium sp. SORGH_AS_0344]MDQ1168705.1 glycerol kinase [Microbacterium proteolyticum]
MGELLRDDAVVVAIDQGTSSTKTLAVDLAGDIVDSALIELRQLHPAPGWVEQDAEEIFDSVRRTLEMIAGRMGDRVATIGLSNQRESAVAWNPRTGEALSAVIGWQDRRTADTARRFTADDHGEWVRRTSGLPLDPMFSALKFSWLLDEIDPDRSRCARGEIALGTVDSWVMFRLTGEHRIEIGNASRTQLLDIRTGRWDDGLLTLFNIPAEALPRIAASDEASRPVAGIRGLRADVRINAVLGDSHSALFAHGARRPGSVKVTYGTGSSIMGLSDTGGDEWNSTALVETIAWSRGGHVARAFEGNVLSTGATVLWLSRLFACDVDELDKLARTVPDAAGVALVPAFAGIGAPWWNPSAKAVISGFDLGTTPAHVARAAFDSITLQIEDVAKAAESITGTAIDALLVDGGPARNDWLMQLQADTSERAVMRPDNPALSGLGVAHMAGLAAGLWTDERLDEIRPAITAFTPNAGPAAAEERRHTWLDALGRSLGVDTPRVSEPSTLI